MQVDLLVPVKPLARAKTRLRGVAQGRACGGLGAWEAHARLVVALVRDTLAAASGAAVVRRAVAICSDEVVRAALGDHVFERLLEAQRSEWSDFRRHVSAWERDRYLEVY